uniref:Peptidoglycan-recognition protein n=1 Tax=Photinus pyralis TaxID=7054 RepID=A0A1Y1LQB5_PHOPY
MANLLLLLCAFGAVAAYAPRIISRSEWGARSSWKPPQTLEENPAPNVIIHHSTGPSCENEHSCKSRVKSFQNYHMDTNRWNDIGYNFLVGEDGNVYEGRGWGKVGAHAPGYNTRSIGICVIGNYESRLPNRAALEAVQNLIAFGAAKGYITYDYALRGHRQVTATLCPGNALYNEITTWGHYTH